MVRQRESNSNVPILGDIESRVEKAQNKPDHVAEVAFEPRLSVKGDAIVNSVDASCVALRGDELRELMYSSIAEHELLLLTWCCNSMRALVWETYEVDVRRCASKVLETHGLNWESLEVAMGATAKNGEVFPQEEKKDRRPLVGRERQDDEAGESLGTAQLPCPQDGGVARVEAVADPSLSNRKRCACLFEDIVLRARRWEV